MAERLDHRDLAASRLTMGYVVALLAVIVAVGLSVLLSARNARRTAGEMAADVSRWSEGGSLPETIERRYPMPAVADADLGRMHDAGYEVAAVRKLMWQGALAITWRRRTAGPRG